MPIYEYHCNECGADSEFIMTQPIASGTLQCKTCGSADLKKLLSITTTHSYPGPKAGKTCCGRDEQCSSPPDGKSCCSR